ncbi:hypothetical protein [Aliarcobacter lanthieri]|uniref:hypothetical protein n=1 Tax=Aliarcobacter lanthieri TaxID=1355374 RepID=UPI00047957EC|nr:hypothetical protein [Aliarcobacter lanthieri]QKF58722.1 hypothetical protein ALANTH_0600 [Aliarcobacter lanthieri]
MYKKIFINLLFIIFIFSGCSQKVNNTSKNESYKLLDEIVIVSEEKDLDITNAPSSGMNVNYVNWGNGMGMAPVFTPNYSFGSVNCKNESEFYSNEIINNISKFKDLFRIQLVRVNNIYEPTKKLLKITPEKYDCTNNYIYVKATLYDVENISKNWNKTNVKQTVKQLESLDNKNIIYQNTFILDKTYSAFAIDDFKKDSFSNVEKKATNIEKFYNVVIKDLKKFMDFSKLKKKIEFSCPKMSEDLTSVIYDEESNTLCMAGIKFSNTNMISSSKRLSMLNALDYKQTFKLNDNITCNKLLFSFAVESKINDTIDFKSTYKEQLIKEFNNNCTVDNIKNTDFIKCKKDNKEYNFLAQSDKYKERLYKRVMLQLDNNCFENFKTIYQGKEENINWNKFISDEDRNFKEIELNTESKNEILNGDYYDKVFYLNQEDGFYLVGQKNIELKNKEKQEVFYYFKSVDQKILDVDKPKDNLMNKRLVLIKKIIKTYKSNGKVEEKEIKIN